MKLFKALYWWRADCLAIASSYSPASFNGTLLAPGRAELPPSCFSALLAFWEAACLRCLFWTAFLVEPPYSRLATTSALAAPLFSSPDLPFFFFDGVDSGYWLHSTRSLFMIGAHSGI